MRGLLTVRGWIVVFKDDKTARGPWRWLTRPGYRHCLAIGWTEQYGVWVIYDPLFNGTFIQIADDDTVDRMLDGFERQGATMLKVISDRTAQIIWTLPPLYCVDRLKSVIGIRAWWIKTPFQLYRHLVRCCQAQPMIKEA